LKVQSVSTAKKKITRQLNFDLKTCCPTCCQSNTWRRKYSDNMDTWIWMRDRANVSFLANWWTISSNCANVRSR